MAKQQHAAQQRELQLFRELRKRTQEYQYQKSEQQTDVFVISSASNNRGLICSFLAGGSD